MIGEFDAADAAFLLTRGEFRRFLLAAIQSAGILGHHAPANGQLGRDLGHFEGRRSLGFELLAMADRGQPEPAQSPQAIATLDLALREAINPAPVSTPAKDRSNARRNRDTDRYDDLPD